jgi:hypothetical protein
MNFSLKSRLPTPYRPEGEIVSARLAALDGALDWAAAAAQAAPWVQAVRENPPPFWAMESLLREYPLSSAEGLGFDALGGGVAADSRCRYGDCFDGRSAVSGRF